MRWWLPVRADVNRMVRRVAEVVQQMTRIESATTELFGQPGDEIALDEVERIGM